MSTCCHGLEGMFGERMAARDLKRYRRKGPSKPTRRLLEAVKQEARGATVLDVGGGVGAIQHELLDAGAAAVVGVDASPAYLSAAEEEARRRGHADKVSYLRGDFVAVAGSVEPADVVTLDRVICCYPDVEALVRRSAERARRLYGLVHPREAWWTRMGVGLTNLALRLARRPFRAYIHPISTVDAVSRESGLALRRRERVGPVWEVAIYERRDRR